MGHRKNKYIALFLLFFLFVFFLAHSRVSLVMAESQACMLNSLRREMEVITSTVISKEQNACHTEDKQQCLTD